MKFKDFFRDKISYIICYFISISLVVLVMYLTVYLKTSSFPAGNVLYAYLISIIVLGIFFLYEYSKVREFNKRLEIILSSQNIIEGIANIGSCKNNEQRKLCKVFDKLHKEYVYKLYKYEETQKQYSIFINQWVHQMKTPVSVINLLLDEENVAPVNERLSSIGEENEKISQGLNIMLYNARINEFNHDFNVESIDIVSVLREAINNNKKLLIRQRIFPKMTGEKVIVQTDRKWIYFVVNQIIINAIKYTSVVDKDKKIIEIKVEENNNEILLSIEDNGIGIPREDLGRVFQAFFTGKNGRRTSESTGMGMYLSKRICDELGHKLFVEAVEQKGTKFSIIFYKGRNIFNLSKL